MRTYVTKTIEHEKLLHDQILVPDHINTPKMSIDQELINLLSTEDDCSALLQNITNTEQFENLIRQHEDKNKLLPIDHSQFADFIPAHFNQVQDIPNEADILAVNTKFDTNFEIPNINYSVACACKSPNEKYHEARICDATCSNKSHPNVDPGREVACSISSKEFNSHGDDAQIKFYEKPSFECPFCSKKFTQRSHLSVHERRHLSQFVAFCKSCNKGFITKSSYKNHLNVKHNGNAHVCPICSNRLSTRSALSDHMKTHDDHRQRSEICEICGKTFLNVRNLRGHLKTHMPSQNYTCNICGKIMCDKKTLDVHIRSHKGEKPLKCDVCQKCFASKNYLRLHLRTHSGIKPYVCTYCDKSFSQKSSLTIHCRYHTGDRPYTCTFCDKCFVTKTHLTGHLKTHDIFNTDITLCTLNSSK